MEYGKKNVYTAYVIGKEKIRQSIFKEILTQNFSKLI